MFSSYSEKGREWGRSASLEAHVFELKVSSRWRWLGRLWNLAGGALLKEVSLGEGIGFKGF